MIGYGGKFIYVTNTLNLMGWPFNISQIEINCNLEKHTSPFVPGIAIFYDSQKQSKVPESVYNNEIFVHHMSDFLAENHHKHRIMKKNS